MSFFTATLKLDVLVQARSKLYTIGIALAVFLGLAGRFAFDAAHAGRILTAFFVLGLGGTTFLFAASIVVAERTQGTLLALRATPLTARAYMASKAFTLTGFAFLESAVVYAVAFWGLPLDPLPMIAGIFVLGVFYALLALGLAARHDAITTFLMPTGLIVGMLLQLPFFYLLDVGPPALWYAIPSMGPQLLMLGAFEPLAGWQWGYAVAMSTGSIILAAVWAHLRFRRYVRLGGR